MIINNYLILTKGNPQGTSIYDVHVKGKGIQPTVDECRWGCMQKLRPHWMF